MFLGEKHGATHRVHLLCFWQPSAHYHWKVLRQFCDLLPRLRSARVHLQLGSGQHYVNMCVVVFGRQIVWRVRTSRWL